MEIIDKKERLTFANGWKKWRVVMVSLDGIAKVFKTNAHIIWMYSSTCARDYAWCSCVDEGGERFESISKIFEKLEREL
jgi:hypothetical protein